MLRKYEKYGRQHFFKGNSSKEFLAWQDEAKEILHHLLGLSKMESCSLDEVADGQEIIGNVTRYHVQYQTEPDITVCAYLLVPESAGRNTPIIICPPGHNGEGKYSVAGCDAYSAVKEKIDYYGYDYGWELAKLGYITLCPDIRGFGEMRESIEEANNLPSALKGDCYWLAHMGEPLGIPVLGMLSWDLMRGVDFLEKCSEKGLGDASRIIVFGFSGGGMQALYLAALESRIKGAFISGYFYGFRDSLLIMNRNCSCNYVPHLFEYFDCGDIASVIAPRPIVIQSCRDDRLNGYRGLENVEEQIQITQKNYQWLNANDNILHETPDGMHHLDKTRLKEDVEWIFNHM